MAKALLDFAEEPLAHVDPIVAEPAVTPPASFDPIVDPDRLPAPPALDTTPSFDSIAARSAIDRIDASTCWARGAVHGYAKANVTLGADGKVKRIEVETPNGVAPDKGCVEQKYAAASVAPFRSSTVVVRSTFYVP
jgi:hypothetical protein